MIFESQEETHHLLEKMHVGWKNVLTKITVNQDNMKNVFTSSPKTQDDAYQNLLVKNKEMRCNEKGVLSAWE